MDYTDDQMEEYFQKIGISKEKRTAEGLKSLIFFLDMNHLHHDLAVILKYRIYHVPGDLSEEERKILITSCKDALTSIRNTRQDIQSDRFQARTDPFSYKVVMLSVPWLSNQIVEYCRNVVKALSHALSKVDHSDELARISYVKTKADYFRYMVEVDMSDENIRNSEECYSQAWELAQKLPPFDFGRLSIALNYSVFYYEIKKDRDAACKLAQQAQHDAKNCRDQLEHLDDRSLCKTDMILKLIEENCESWMSRDRMSMEDEQTEPVGLPMENHKLNNQCQPCEQAS